MSTYSIKLVKQTYKKQLERSIEPRVKDGEERAGKNAPLTFFKVGKCKDGGIVNAPVAGDSLNVCTEVISQFTQSMDYAMTLRSKYGMIKKEYYTAMKEIESNPDVLGYKVWLQYYPEMSENEKDVTITLFCKNTNRKHVNKVMLELKKLVRFNDSRQEITAPSASDQLIDSSISMAQPVTK